MRILKTALVVGLVLQTVGMSRERVCYEFVDTTLKLVFGHALSSPADHFCIQQALTIAGVPSGCKISVISEPGALWIGRTEAMTATWDDCLSKEYTFLVSNADTLTQIEDTRYYDSRRVAYSPSQALHLSVNPQSLEGTAFGLKIRQIVPEN